MVRKVSHWPLTILGSFSSLFNLFLPIVMSRKMNVAHVGEFKVFFLYLAMVPALSLGMGFTNGTYLWGADPRNAKEKVRAAFVLALLSGVAAAAVALLYGAIWGWNIQIFLFAAACPPAVAATIFEAKLVASGEVKKAAAFSAGFEFLRLASMLCAVFFQAEAITLFAIHGTISWIKLLASCKGIGLISPFGHTFRKERPELFRYAMPVSFAAIFDLLVLNADRYVLSVMLSAADFAIYAFGCLMVPPLFVFEQSVNQVLIPKLSATAPGSRKGAELYRRAIEDLFLLLAPCTAGLIALADPLVRMLFTDAYRAAGTYLHWYALYYVLSSVPQDVFARARGASKWILGTAVVFGIGALSFTYIGARWFGALGALQAFVLVQALRRVYAIYYFSKSERAPVGRIFPFQAVAHIALAAFLAALVANFVSTHLERAAHAFIIGGLAFTPVYFGLLLISPPPSFHRLLRTWSRR